MRTIGLFLGFLFLSPSVSGHQAVAQAIPQSTDLAAPQTIPSGDRGPVNSQEPSRSKNQKKEKDSSDSRVEHKLHFRLGTFALGVGYSYWSGPRPYLDGYYPFSPLGTEYSAFWLPYWEFDPSFAPGYLAYGSAKGEVRLAAEPKSAEVYLDRAYAGTADHLRSMWLEPGAYDLSVAAAGREFFNRRIYVLSGKSVKITAKLLTAEMKPEGGKDKP